jgi:hypothetical protein
LREFNDSATRAIKRLYAGPKREKGMYHDREDSDSDSGDEGTEDLDESTGPNETVFLVYLYVSITVHMYSKLIVAFYSRWRSLDGKSSFSWIPSKK